MSDSEGGYHVLLVDPLEDFCNPEGALYVPGADKDMERLGRMVRRRKQKISEMHVLIDSHPYFHVAHPVYWIDSQGNHPPPFTIIGSADVDGGKWMASVPALRRMARAYVRALEQDGRYPLCIWPPHCLIGSPGQCVVPAVLEALHEWAAQGAAVDFRPKGSDPHKEQYSGIRAEVRDPGSPSTWTDSALVEALLTARAIGIGGVAGSHCVACTVQDIAKEFGSDEYVKKLVLLTDAISPVPGMEHLQEQFITEMTACGMQLSTTEEFLA